MREVIDGRVYDTGTSRCVGAVSDYVNPHSFNNEDYYELEIYRKRNGEFFLYGTGGRNTIFGGRRNVYLYVDTSKIIPLSDTEAKYWCEKAY